MDCAYVYWKGEVVRNAVLLLLLRLMNSVTSYRVSEMELNDETYQKNLMCRFSSVNPCEADNDL